MSAEPIKQSAVLTAPSCDSTAYPTMSVAVIFEMMCHIPIWRSDDDTSRHTCPFLIFALLEIVVESSFWVAGRDNKLVTVQQNYSFLLFRGAKRTGIEIYLKIL